MKLTRSVPVTIADSIVNTVDQINRFLNFTFSLTICNYTLLLCLEIAFPVYQSRFGDIFITLVGFLRLLPVLTLQAVETSLFTFLCSADL